MNFYSSLKTQFKYPQHRCILSPLIGFYVSFLHVLTFSIIPQTQRIPSHWNMSPSATGMVSCLLLGTRGAKLSPSPCQVLRSSLLNEHVVL